MQPQRLRLFIWEYSREQTDTARVCLPLCRRAGEGEKKKNNKKMPARFKNKWKRKDINVVVDGGEAKKGAWISNDVVA